MTPIDAAERAKCPRNDKESSGNIDVSHILGDGYLMSVQSHRKSSDPELVEGGQVVAMC